MPSMRFFAGYVSGAACAAFGAFLFFMGWSIAWGFAVILLFYVAMKTLSDVMHSPRGTPTRPLFKHVYKDGPKAGTVDVFYCPLFHFAEKDIVYKADLDSLFRKNDGSEYTINLWYNGTLQEIYDASDAL